MAMVRKKPEGKSASLLRAKRVFLVNMALFACLIAVAVFHISGDDEQTENKPPPPVPEKVWSLAELAYLKGEMQALREHPGTMPEYEEEWVRKHAEQAIRLDREFDGIDETLEEALAVEYFRGYTERFEDYYDGHAARDFGYRHGVKYNPDLYGMFPRGTAALLTTNRKKLEQVFVIPDEATWRLFCDAFDLGFTQGYPIIEEGVTVQSRRDEIRLFDD